MKKIIIVTFILSLLTIGIIENIRLQKPFDDSAKISGLSSEDVEISVSYDAIINFSDINLSIKTYNNTTFTESKMKELLYNYSSKLKTRDYDMIIFTYKNTRKTRMLFKDFKMISAYPFNSDMSNYYFNKGFDYVMNKDTKLEGGLYNVWTTESVTQNILIKPFVK